MRWAWPPAVSVAGLLAVADTPSPRMVGVDNAEVGVEVGELSPGKDALDEAFSGEAEDEVEG